MAPLPGQTDFDGARLALVGVVHLDPGGQAKLAGLLEELRPDLITLQISPYAVRWRRAWSPELRDRLARNTALAAERLGLDHGAAMAHGAIRTVAAQLRLPFEFVAARDHQRRAGGRIRLVEDSARSRRWLAELAEDVLSVDNLANLLATPDVSRDARSRGAWQRARWGVGRIDPEKSDAALAEAVRRAHGRFRPRLHLHVCGWGHLDALTAQLADLGPRARLLRGEAGPLGRTAASDPETPPPDVTRPAHAWRAGPVPTFCRKSLR